jgi:hypothetical protein
VSLDGLANPDTSGPNRIIVGRPTQGSRLEQFGVWYLTGTEVRIRAQGEEGTGLRYFSATPGESSWPEPPRDVHDPAAWRDLRYVANMKALVSDARIDQSLLGRDDSRPRALPSSLAARVLLEAGLIQGGIPSQETYREDVFAFRGAKAEPTLRQALTDTLEWTFTSQAAAVVIEITPLEGGPMKRLLFAPSATPHQVFVSNLPTDDASHGADHGEMSRDDMAAAHFGVYYRLLENAPPDQPLPELWEAPLPKGSGLGRPIFCPPAVFPEQ